MKFQVPKELKLPYFFPEEEIILEEGNEEVQSGLFFYYELLYYNGETAFLKPWQNPEEYISNVMQEWKEREVRLRGIFRARTSNSKGEMDAGISVLFLLLFWVNGQPVRLVDWQNSVREFKWKPVNAVERISFVLDRCSFSAFIQLAELIQEQLKQYAKKCIMEKKK